MVIEIRVRNKGELVSQATLYTIEEAVAELGRIERRQIKKKQEESHEYLIPEEEYDN